MLLGGSSAVAGAVMLGRPGIGYITLDADGFETSSIYGKVVRTHWRDVSEFSRQWFPSGPMVGWTIVYDVYDVPDLPMLLDNYGLSQGELVWLMNEWRARALGHSPARRSG